MEVIGLNRRNKPLRKPLVWTVATKKPSTKSAKSQIDCIKSAIYTVTGIKPNELIFGGRGKDVSLARHLFFYFMVKIKYDIGYSYRLIGEDVRRNHATVINGNNNIKRLLSQPWEREVRRIVMDVSELTGIRYDT